MAEQGQGGQVTLSVSNNALLAVSILLSFIILTIGIIIGMGNIATGLASLQISVAGSGALGGGGNGSLTPAVASPAAPPATPPPAPPAGQTASLAGIEKGAAGILGSDEAPVVVVEYSDFQCPFCRRFFNATKKQLEEEYVETGKVQFIYKDFPLDSIHPMARPYALAARCAGEQGKFWEFHDKIFEEQNKFGQGTVFSLSLDDVKAWAGELGLDTDAFNACVDSRKFDSVIQANFDEGRSVGVSGTPSFLVGRRDGTGQLLVGAQPFSVFKAAIDSLDT